MKTIMLYAVMAATMLAAPVSAQDVSAFDQCKSCHVVTAPDGRNIAGRGRTGPNLYGIIGQPAGYQPDFNYSPGALAARDAGLVWTQANLAEFLSNPTAFLQDFTGDDSVRSRMSYRMRTGQAEVAAFLASVR